MTKHTGGDWTLAAFPEQEGWKVLGPQGSTESPEQPPEREWIATVFELPNAGLIVAAPKLLEACKGLIEIADADLSMDVAGTNARLAAARAAIAKATA